jgi:hypothetical protein
MFRADDLHKENKRLSSWVVEALAGWTQKYQKKNQNYSQSWLLSGQTLALWFPDGITIRSPKSQVMHGLVVRMLDKLIRASNLTLAGEADKVGEAASETFFDLGVYAFMAGVACFMGSTEEAFMAALGKQASVRESDPDDRQHAG